MELGRYELASEIAAEVRRDVQACDCHIDHQVVDWSSIGPGVAGGGLWQCVPHHFPVLELV